MHGNYQNTMRKPEVGRLKAELLLGPTIALGVCEKQEDVERQKRIRELYEAHRVALYRYLRSLGLSRDQAEDVIQEVYLRLATHLSEPQQDSNLRSWLFQVAYRLSMDVYRNESRDHVYTEPLSAVLSEPADTRDDPELHYMQREAIERVNQAMKALTPKQRSGILLRAQGLRYAEIGTVLGVSEARAIHLVKRALQKVAGGL